MLKFVTFDTMKGRENYVLFKSKAELLFMLHITYVLCAMEKSSFISLGFAKWNLMFHSNIKYPSELIFGMENFSCRTRVDKEP